MATQTDPTPTNIARGALIVVEGLDRSGKTTQVKLLEERFLKEGKKVKAMRFPGTSNFNTSSPLLGIAPPSNKATHPMPLLQITKLTCQSSQTAQPPSAA